MIRNRRFDYLFNELTMKPIEFKTKYMQYAINCENATGVPALITMAQAVLESGWGEHAVGNMFFGIKDSDGINGNEQLLTTTEYSKKSTIKVPIIISKTFDPIKKLWKFIVKDYFRKYDTPEQSFVEHGEFLRKNKRYTKCFTTTDPYRFAEYLQECGYATDPMYALKLKNIINLLK